jgi:hypothetical protein
LLIPFAGENVCKAKVQEILKRMPTGAFSLSYWEKLSNSTPSGRGGQLVNLVLSGQEVKKSAQVAKKSNPLKQAECSGPSTFINGEFAGYISLSHIEFFYYHFHRSKSHPYTTPGK